MKLLALADIHGREDVVYMVQELQGLHNFDAILIAGDITNFGPAEFALEILNAMPTRIFAVPGNCDPPEVIQAIEKSRASNLHARASSLGDFKIAGLGGVNGGFNMGITFTDEFARNFLGNCRGCIFLTHQPPFGILDEVPGGKHIGSRGIMDAVRMAKPPLVISGHVHEARGKLITDDTIFINPGPARDGYAAIVDLDAREVIMLER